MKSPYWRRKNKRNSWEIDTELNFVNTFDNIKVDKNLIPSFMGDHSGYYSDLAPVPHYDPIEIIFEILGIGVLIVTWIFF